MAGYGHFEGFPGGADLGLAGVGLPEILYIIHNGIEGGGQPTYFIVGEIEALPVDVARYRLGAAVEQAEGPVAALERLEPVFNLVFG